MAMSEMRHFVHQPRGALRRYVREILWVRSARPRAQVLLPETTLTLALRQSGSALLHGETLPHAIVSGLQQRTRTVEHAAGSSLVIVRFTEVGAPAILQDRVDLLYNRTVPLDDFLPRQEIDDIQNMLADTHGMRRQILSVERFLTSQIRAQNEISPQIEAAALMIRNCEGRSSIAAIARHAAMSQSALERVRPQRLSPVWPVYSMSAGCGTREGALQRSPLKLVTRINRTWCTTSGSSLKHRRKCFFAALPLAICRLFTSSSGSAFATFVA
jgi:hypothetical protein